MVSRLEKSVITMLADLGIEAQSRTDAPGVYTDDCKIASLGLRVKQGCCYHGLSLNIAMDLSPFSGINPCGLADMEMIDLTRLGYDITMEQAKQRFVAAITEQMK